MLTASSGMDVRPGPAEAPGRDQVWTVLALAAVLATFVHLHTVYTRVAGYSAVLGALATVGYLGLLVCAAAALVATSRRGRLFVDVGTLVVVVGVNLLQVPVLAARGLVGSVDEGQLTNAAIRTQIAGGDAYRASYEHVVTHATRLMDGSPVAHYDYPPLPLLLGSVGSHLWHGLADVAVLNVLALCVAAVLGFVLLPAQLRPSAVLAVLSIGFLDTRAIIGEPVVLTLPLLIAATARWTRIGTSGHRSRDVLAGACLGLAAATQQLVWFLVPFLLVAVWCLRRGEGSTPRATARLLPYAGAAGAAFAAVNLPFVLRDASAWWHGLTEVITQHAVPDGPGFPSLSIDLFHGSGSLEDFRLAAGLVYAALFVAVLLVPRRMGAAFAVLPMLSFLWSLRSEDSYYLAFAPLWLLLAAVTPAGALDRARGLWPERLPRIRAGVVAAAFVPPVGLLVMGLLAPAPLQLRVAANRAGGASQALAVAVRDEATRPLQPHFKLERGGRTTPFLSVLTGPATVGPHQSVLYRLRLPVGVRVRQGERLLAYTDLPETASVGTVP